MDVLKEKGAMKVLLLAPLPPPNGGIASWAVRMLESNAANRWGFEVVDEKVIKRDVFGSRKKNNLFIELKRTLMIWWNLWRRLKDKSFLVVHSNIPALPKSIIRELGSLAISKIKKRKFIVHYHCTVPNLVKGKLRSLLFRILSNNSDAIIVLNTPSKAFSEEISNTPVFLIPNFINQHEIIDEKAINDTIRSVLYVGGVIPEKGCLDIIRAAGQLPNILFKLIGKTSKEIVSQQKTDNVLLTEEQPKTIVSEELDKADVFLFPSFFPGEGFSVALLEAMAHGVPCVVSNWAANADMIQNQGGIIIPVHDVSALVEAIKSMEDKKKRDEMSKWNINKVRDCYCDKQVMDMYINTYKKVLRS